MGPLVTRILGQNPGKFTLQGSHCPLMPRGYLTVLPQGTNTYLIGRSAPYILIDTGEGKPEYIPQLRTTLESSSNGQCPISDIIITHKHQDHHGGLIDVLDFLSSQRSTNSTESWHPPCIHLHPLPAGVTDSSLTATISRLNDGHQVQTADASAMLEVVHTPGHTADSISLILFDLSEAKSPVPVALFTADTVLGAGTAVFEDLSLYMQSLRRLVELPIWTHSITLHPGHGPAVPPSHPNRTLRPISLTGRQGKTRLLTYSRRVMGKPRPGEKPVSDVGEYDGVKMEQVGAAGMDAEWEWAGLGTGTETKL
ncbi:Metallo-beta-lactamase superfamily [Rhizoctonia solani]|uniref:Metallo-beta-lactamase superfamily n=1 Tax=Rhizoctonia solani TaxID=456999 RepID=A0A8H7IHQ8_9AGAM|nr:Metallo-beta-lactamase superfamily [Rhizoctonia solani]